VFFLQKKGLGPLGVKVPMCFYLELIDALNGLVNVQFHLKESRPDLQKRKPYLESPSPILLPLVASLSEYAAAL